MSSKIERADIIYFLGPTTISPTTDEIKDTIDEMEKGSTVLESTSLSKKLQERWMAVPASFRIQRRKPQSNKLCFEKLWTLSSKTKKNVKLPR